jgi:hypothetical protein
MIGSRKIPFGSALSVAVSVGSAETWERMAASASAGVVITSRFV